MNIIENNYCNTIIHKILRGTDEIICPFCDIQINKQSVKKIELCCSKQHLINDNGIEVCLNCGVQSGNNPYVMPVINFNENKFKFRNKTIYNRQYHIQNIINLYDIKQQFPWNIRDKIYKIFNKINKTQELLNKQYNRKRIISIHYILRCILILMDQKYKFIPLPKHKKTIKFYKKYWKNINKLIGKDINNIIKK